MSEWQPIETAPKDGTLLLTWHRDREDSPGNGCWGLLWWAGDCWKEDLTNEVCEYEPTHWMRPPRPPGC